MIWSMDLEMYYRITDLKTRTSNSVLKILEHAEMNYKIHEAGVLDDLTTNLKKWVDLLSVSRVADRKKGEEMLAKVMRHMPPNFFDRLPKYVESLSEVD